jgi:predicted dehydrogenase
MKVAVLGCGMIAEQAHIPGLLATGRAEVAVLYGPDTPRSCRLAETFGIADLVHDIDAVFAHPGLDAAIVALPNYQHGPAALGAIAAGLPLLLEKPVAADIGTARAIVAAAQAAGVTLAMHLPHRHRPVIRELKRLVETGFFGTLQSIEIRLLRRAGIPGFGSWFTRRELAGGGVLMDLGPHVLDMALWIAGFPEVADVSARLSSLHGPRGLGLGDWGVHKPFAAGDATQFDVDDHASLRIALASGAVIDCELAWATFGADESRIRIVGDRGGADYRPDAYGAATPLRLFAYDAEGRPADRFPPGLPVDDADLVPAWRLCAAGFVDTVATGRAPDASGADALAVAEIIERACRPA